MDQMMNGLANRLNDSGEKDVIIAKVDCSTETSLCKGIHISCSVKVYFHKRIIFCHSNYLMYTVFPFNTTTMITSFQMNTVIQFLQQLTITLNQV